MRFSTIVMELRWSHVTFSNCDRVEVESCDSQRLWSSRSRGTSQAAKHVCIVDFSCTSPEIVARRRAESVYEGMMVRESVVDARIVFTPSEQ